MENKSYFKHQMFGKIKTNYLFGQATHQWSLSKIPHNLHCKITKVNLLALGHFTIYYQ